MELIPKQCHVALLCGGTSGEREISLASGQGAYSALTEAGFTVEILDTAKRNDLIRLLTDSFDVAFICLHGTMGEDGTVQGMLELIGLPYTGSGVLASAVAMDKARAKLFYRSQNLPTPRSLAYSVITEAALDEIEGTVGFPCVVKPSCEGSALGVSIVDNKEDLQSALDKSLKNSSKVLVEKFVQGMEVTVAVIGNESPEALPVIQIVPRNEFYDFESKYAPGGSDHICPAPLPDKLTHLLQEYACKAHTVLGCKGMSRTDFIIDADNNPWLLETNTIPGMTETSLLPDAAKAQGMSFAELCTKLVEFALSDQTATM